MPDNHAEEQAAQAQKLEALGRFAGGIAQDSNNILSIIEGYTHMAIRQLKEGTLTPAHLQKILSSTQRGAGLTRQMLAFARQKVDADDKTDIVETLRQQNVLLGPLLGGKIALRMMLPESPAWVAASADQVMQVVLNLSLNARDAMPEGGELRVTIAECPPEMLPRRLKEKDPGKPCMRLSFTDSGRGIAPDVLPRIFDPFFTTKQSPQGTGLGLSVVHGIVDQVGGVIEVESKEGAGTTFNIYLPTALPGNIVLEDRRGAVSLAGKTILLAEDEPELRDILTVMLEDMEMKVLPASNGNHALQVQEDFGGPIDFLLTDVVMPEMDGARLGSLFSSLRPDSNVIYMSGYPFIDGKPGFGLPKDAMLLGKPLAEETVRAVLERALARRNARLARDETGDIP
jgi:two-component system cell cycle sensor histidine kinase/response regulator CckA